MKRILLVLGVIMSAVQLLDAADFGGDWSGRLQVAPGTSLRLVFHIDTSDRSISMDSPDQGAMGIPCQTLVLDADSVSLSIPALYLTYDGRLRGDSIRGTFRQGGIQLPLSLERGTPMVTRTQIPLPPFPYVEESVRIVNAGAGSVLAGTLTMPDGHDASTPVAVLVTGSGAQNRDEELFGHKPFAVIADYLARNGIATLRYDDRGVGESTGDVAEATTLDFASDAGAAVDWLRSRGGFGNVGIIGHSEGGMIACMLGASDEAPDFIISVAGPSVKGADILDFQNTRALMRSGMSEDLAMQYASDARDKIERDSGQVWMRFFLKYDPSSDLRNLKCPAMLIYGEKDMQVPPSLNLEPAKTLAAKAEVVCYPGLNHLMQHAESGDVSEYSSISETISPQVLADIVKFISGIEKL